MLFLFPTNIKNPCLHIIAMMTTLQKRVLIVDDHHRVHDYATRAFRDFQRWHALAPREARAIISAQQREHDARKPFDLLSCDINMSEDGRYGPIGMPLMRWFDGRFTEIPIICHSDDVQSARELSFVHFVMKIGFASKEFNASEARLRARALDLLFGKQDFSEQIKMAQGLGIRANIADLEIPMMLRLYVKHLRENLQALCITIRSLKKLAKPEDPLSDVLELAKAGYIDDATLIEFIRYMNSVIK